MKYLIGSFYLYIIWLIRVVTVVNVIVPSCPISIGAGLGIDGEAVHIIYQSTMLDQSRTPLHTGFHYSTQPLKKYDCHILLFSKYV